QLKRLVCYNNRLTALDLSTNTQLTNLDIGRNLYPTLDLSKNTLLQSLDCADSPNLTKVCVVDSVAYNANPTNYFKDVSTTFIQECALLTSWDSEKVNSANMEVYPNPSISSFKLNNSLGDALHIFNALGVLVESFYSPLPSEFGQNYPRGIYCAQYQNLGKTTKISLVKE
ncbi:MAG: hypothetical protein K2Q22_16705, partial [Cytophagales bacterium]|nr:hypothetical protein [Cytophagales bacterium]